MAQTYTKDKIDQLLETAGTTVVANPDPAGTTALTGIQIGDTKYAVGGGAQGYTITNLLSMMSTQDWESMQSLIRGGVSGIGTYTLTNSYAGNNKDYIDITGNLPAPQAYTSVNMRLHKNGTFNGTNYFGSWADKTSTYSFIMSVYIAGNSSSGGKITVKIEISN